MNKLAGPLGWKLRLAPFQLRRIHPYRTPTAPARHLDPEYFAPVTLPGDDEAQAKGDLYALWRTIPEGHKWHHYFRTYSEVLSRFGDAPVRLLEIGVYKGGSARMWNRFLPPGSVVVGIDINPDCARYGEEENNLYIRIGDQSDRAFLRRIVEEFGPFDVILDDGSHRSSHMIKSFNYLFLHGLKSPGTYLAEDTHACFWSDFRDQDYSFIDLSRDLVDLSHAHYVDLPSEIHFRKDHPERAHSAKVPRIAALIDEIQFRDSLVVIQKAERAALPVSEQLA